MTMVSYAQNFEDVMLARALQHVEHGFYIDVGAQDPEEYSVTKAFYDRGWRGINIEPVRHWFEKLASQRVHDINLATALAERPGQLHFYNIRDTGLSTTNPDYAARHAEAGFTVEEEDVPCTTLDQICKDHHVGTVHFLKVDCEGAEKSVLQGFSLDSVRPWVILVEATEPLSDKPNYMQWESLLLGRGYHFVYDDGLNRFYVADECSELDASFSHPPNVFDEFVRASELLAQKRLQEAHADLQAARDVERIGNLKSDLDQAKIRATFLDQENERREAALVEHRRLLQEAAEREARLFSKAQADAERWQAHLEYLHTENERREAALVEHRRVLEEGGVLDPEQAAAVLGELEQWRRQAAYLHAENERREAALVEHRRVLDEVGARESEQVAAVRGEAEQWRAQAEYLRAENERREAALVEHRRLLGETDAREAEQVVAAREEAGQWRRQAEYLHAENERREAALVDLRAADACNKQLLGDCRIELQHATEKLASQNILLEKSAREAEALVAELEHKDDGLRECGSRLRALQEEVDRLHHDVAARDRELARCSDTISCILRSTSWRVTWPLRAVKRVLTRLARWLGLIVYHLVRWPARLVRPLWRALAAWSWLSRLAIRMAGEHSAITQHTRLFLYGRTQAQAGDPSVPGEEQPPELGWHAARIYGQLRAEETRNREGGTPS